MQVIKRKLLLWSTVEKIKLSDKIKYLSLEKYSIGKTLQPSLAYDQSYQIFSLLRTEH